MMSTIVLETCTGI